MTHVKRNRQEDGVATLVAEIEDDLDWPLPPSLRALAAPAANIHHVERFSEATPTTRREAAGRTLAGLRFSWLARPRAPARPGERGRPSGVMLMRRKKLRMTVTGLRSEWCPSTA